MFAQDASPDVALERERLLQAYRDRRIDRGRFELEDIAWISQLAAAGHVPADALLHRVADGERLGDLYQESPERFEAAAPRVPCLAGLMAVRVSVRAPLDLPALNRWLEAAGPVCRAIGRAFAAFEELGIATTSGDRILLAQALKMHWNAGRDDARPAAELLAAMAEARSGNSGLTGEGIALLRRAAKIAPGGARRWAWLYECAERSPAIRGFLWQYPVPSLRKPDPLMWLALEVETGAADGKPDLDAAIHLYEMGTNVEAWAGEPGGALRPEFCLAVARWLTWRRQAEDQRAENAAQGWLARARSQ